MTTRIRRGEVELALRSWGDAGAPPVVLVHGFPDTSAVWSRAAERLAARGYRAVAYDLRGAGASSKPKSIAAYALAELAMDLDAVLEHAGGRAHVVGHDWGSILAWEAATEPAIAARIASFTSISGPCLDHVGHWIREQPRGVVARQALRSWYIAAFHAPGLARLAPGVNMYRANVVAALRHPRARTTELPVQVIVPRRDAFVGRELVCGVERWAPRAIVRELDGGHWVQRSHPAAVAELVDEFLKGVAS